MMKYQRKLFRDQMAYLHRKTLERVGADTKVMVAAMRDVEILTNTGNIFSRTQPV